MKRGIILVFISVSLLAFSGFAQASPSVLVVPGGKAPGFANQKIDGSGYVYASDHIGKGWLLLDFFATDCKPCVAELPELEKLLAAYASPKDAGKRLTGILFAQDVDVARVTAFFASKKTAFILAADSYSITYRKYKGPGDTLELPMLFVIAPDGTVAFVASSGAADELSRLKAFLSSALK